MMRALVGASRKVVVTLDVETHLTDSERTPSMVNSESKYRVRVIVRGKPKDHEVYSDNMSQKEAQDELGNLYPETTGPQDREVRLDWIAVKRSDLIAATIEPAPGFLFA